MCQVWKSQHAQQQQQSACPLLQLHSCAQQPTKLVKQDITHYSKEPKRCGLHSLPPHMEKKLTLAYRVLPPSSVRSRILLATSHEDTPARLHSIA